MFKFKIKYNDKNLIIIEKPIGIDSKLINKIIFFKKINLPNKGVLNRLDKYTSGIILIAKNVFFYYFFKKILLNKIVKKTYKTFIKKRKNGIINLSIKKKKKSIIKKNGKNSITFYKIIKLGKKYNFINVYIKTGRTHQIRLHLNHIGFKLMNDFYIKNNIYCNTLHFFSIFFYYPLLKKNFYLSCNLPKEMKKIFLNNFLK